MRNLSNTGLSMSQAQSISNLCNQRCIEIDNKIKQINNSSAKINILQGSEFKDIEMTKANVMPSNIIDMLKSKASYHACQAFLMDSIKTKNKELDSIRIRKFTTELVEPSEKEYVNSALLKNVDDRYGWDQLTDSEWNEYLEAEAYASHIGQFIHKDGKLDVLRRELPNIAGISWMEIEEGKKTPITITTHHTAEQLYDIHEQLATLHRQYEQRVNYFKAKTANIVTEENARIARENAKTLSSDHEINEKIRNEYLVEYNKYLDLVKQEKLLFEEKRHTDTSYTANCRIVVDPRFQSVIDELMPRDK